jgi:hypothetical protein
MNARASRGDIVSGDSHTLYRSRDLYLVRKLDHACDLARELASLRDRADYANDGASDYRSELARTHINAIAGEAPAIRDRVVRLIRFGEREQADRLLGELTVVWARAGALAGKLGRPGREVYLANELRRTMDRALGPVGRRTRRVKRRYGRPARIAGRLVDAAAQLLPRRYQARYREEYQGELADLAATGAGRWQQLRYSVRLLARSAHLRAALMGQRRRQAAL